MTLKDSLLALTIVALWGLHLVIIRIGALEVPPLFLLTIRFVFVTAIFMPFAKRISLETIKNVGSYALSYFVMHLSTIYLALKFLDAGLTGLILQTQVPFAIVLSWFVYSEKFGFKTFLGLITAFCGVAVITYQPVASFSLIGIVLVLVSAFFWAVGSLRMRSIKTLNFATMTGYSHLLALPFICLSTYLLEDSHLDRLYTANPYTLTGVLAYQVILMSLCLYGWKYLISHNPVYKVTAFSLLAPIFAVIFGILILGESLSWQTIIGGGIALTGVGIVTWRKAQKQTHS